MKITDNLQAWEALVITARTQSLSRTAIVLDMDLTKVQIYTISCTALHPVVHAAEFFTPAADSSIEFFF